MLLTDAIDRWVDAHERQLPLDQRSLARSVASRLRVGRDADRLVDATAPGDVAELLTGFADYERSEVGAVIHAARAWAISNPTDNDNERDAVAPPLHGPIAGPTAPAAGWWQASDDNWYPPEDHPDAVEHTPLPTTAPGPATTNPSTTTSGPAEPLATFAPPDERAPTSAPQAPPALEPPPPQPRATPPPPVSGNSRRSTGLLIGIAAGAMVIVGALVALLAAGSSSTPDSIARAEQPERSPVPTPDVAPRSQPDLAGSRRDPFPTDTPQVLALASYDEADGSLWQVTVGELRDITDAVLAENQFNEPPPDGARYVGFDVTLTLLDGAIEPLAPDAAFGWRIIGGATNTIYDSSTIETENFGCGVAPNSYDLYQSVMIGGSVTGTVCIPLLDDDLSHPDTVAAMRVDQDNWFVFSPSGSANSPLEQPNAARFDRVPTSLGSLGAPYAFDTDVEVTIEDFTGNAVDWEIRVGPPSDITDAVLAENEFNDPPPDGSVFLGFTVTMTVLDATTEPATFSFGTEWEYVGAASGAVHTPYSVSSGGCGVAPNQFDPFTELLIGGSLTGTICIPVVVDDAADPASLVSLYLGGAASERLGFAAPG